MYKEVFPAWAVWQLQIILHLERYWETEVTRDFTCTRVMKVKSEEKMR